jgi:hypothetical protein
VLARFGRIGLARSWWAASGFATYLVLIALIGGVGYQVASGEGLSLPGFSTVQAIWKADTSLPALGQVDREIGADALHDSAAHPSPGAVANASPGPGASPRPSGSPGSPPPRPSPNPLPTVLPQPTPRTGTVTGYAWVYRQVTPASACGDPAIPGTLPDNPNTDCQVLYGVTVTLTVNATGQRLGPVISSTSGKWSQWNVPGVRPLTTFTVVCSKPGYHDHNAGGNQSQGETDSNGNALPGGADGQTNQYDCMMQPTGVVSGLVTDQTTNKPIAGAMVWIEENDKPGVPVSQATSNSSGNYSISGSAPSHQYLLRASASGYAPFQVEINTDASGNDSGQNISMVPG